jgi:hypothetical protein
MQSPPVKERIRLAGAVAEPAVDLFVDARPIEGVVGSLDVAVERDVPLILTTPADGSSLRGRRCS